MKPSTDGSAAGTRPESHGRRGAFLLAAFLRGRCRVCASPVVGTRGDAAMALALSVLLSVASCVKEIPPSAPAVRTDSVFQVGITSAQVALTVTSDGGSAVTERGVFFGPAPLAVGGGTRIASGSGVGTLTVALPGLATGTAYQVRAYAQNAVGLTYGNTLDFSTVRVFPPTFNDSGLQVTSVGQYDAALLLPALVNKGGTPVIERGVVWAKTANPVVSTAQKRVLTADTLRQQTTIAGLGAKSKYFIREYVTHALGTYYGPETSFTTNPDLQTVEVGDLYAGGIVFYLLKPGDPGYDATTKRGYVAEVSVSIVGLQWNNGSTLALVGGTSSAVGSGRANTDAITGRLGTGSYAASRCQNLVLNGYDDWHLPSLGEMQLLYTNLKSTFMGLTYWTSTETDANNARYLYGGDGGIGSGAKLNRYLVRAVRAF